MIKRLLLLCFLATLMADEMLDLGLSLGGGLSAKNAYLYLLILLILTEKTFVSESSGIQLPSVHALFILLIADACLSLLTVQLALVYPGYELVPAVAAIKGQLVDPYLIFAVFFYAAPTRADALAAAQWMVSLVVVVNFVTLLDIYDAPNLGLIERYRGRLNGPLGQPNEYGAFLAFFIPITFTMALAAKNKFAKLFFFTGCMLSFGFLVQTVSRGSYAALVGGVLLAAWLLRRGVGWKTSFRWGLGLTAAGALVVLVFAQDVIWELEERVVGRTLSGDSFEVTSGRTWIWAEAIEYQMERPWSFLTGVGWDTFSMFNSFSAHNTYLDYLFNLGLIGLFLFVGLIVALLQHAITAFFATEARADKLLLAGLVAGWCAILVILMSGTFSKPWLFVWAYTGLGMRVVYALTRVPEASDETVSRLDRLRGIGAR